MGNTYEVRVKILNAPLLNIMRLNGLETAADLHRATGVSQQEIGKMLNLKKPAFTQSGKVFGSVDKIAKFFNVIPELLYPEDNVYVSLEINEASRQLEGEELQRLLHTSSDPLNLLEEEEAKELTKISSITKNLTPREKTIISLRFEEGLTLQEISAKFNVSRCRIRHIILRGLDKLRREALINKPEWFRCSDNDTSKG